MYKGRCVFSWGGGGGEEGRVENFGIFFGKSVGPPLSLIQKPPEALPLVTDKSATLPSLLQGRFHAVETSERFACERKKFEYKYISILKVCELKQENAKN